MREDRNRESVALHASDAQEVGGVEGVRGPRVARVAPRVAGVEIVLRVTAPHDAPLGAPRDDHAARLVGVLLARLAADRPELLRCEDHRPPARAGMIATSSPSLSGVASPSSDSI